METYETFVPAGVMTTRRRRTLNSPVWALLTPAIGGLAGVIAHYPYGMWIGVVITLIVAAAAAIIVGGIWRRTGAATLATLCVLALPLFAGPTFYEL
ncbi:hypothetical protein [Streptomyces sp. NPDC086787]|uniref:hypothetical protein n=1 Tax=Streptomyces sp. NPDC086787 TaxID=3365759 RepID=UPI0038135437